MQRNIFFIICTAIVGYFFVIFLACKTYSWMQGTIIFWNIVLMTCLCLASVLANRAYLRMLRCDRIATKVDRNLNIFSFIGAKHAFMKIPMQYSAVFIIGLVVISISICGLEFSGLADYFQIEANPSDVSDIIIASIKTKTFS